MGSYASPEAEAVKNRGKNIGLQMYSLREAIDDESIGLDSVIRVIGEMGYRYVETAGYNDGRIYGLTPGEFKARLDAAGYYALSCHVRRDIAANMDDVWAWWDQCIATHKAAGMTYIVVPSMPVPETLEGLKAYCDYFNQIGEKCNAAGLKFGYHNHAYEFEKVYGDGPVMYDYLVQNTDPGKVFFELDVYWCQKGGREASGLFSAYPNRFTVLHIKDEEELGASGYMDFAGIFNNIDKAGSKYLIVEVERYNVPPIQSVALSLDYLNEAAFVEDNYAE
jgi:sugar phosphate isomerase/epimerase